MKVAITHTKNPATGWDITVTATAENKELVAVVKTVINDFPEPDDTLDPAANFYDRAYTQKGIYPGENKVVVTVRDADANPTVAVHKWAS